VKPGGVVGAIIGCQHVAALGFRFAKVLLRYQRMLDFLINVTSSWTKSYYSLFGKMCLWWIVRVPQGG
jgi:hypothetical protein